MDECKHEWSIDYDEWHCDDNCYYCHDVLAKVEKW
jgi:coenzyme F420-reducing hydrogenase beta subunit